MAIPTGPATKQSFARKCVPKQSLRSRGGNEGRKLICQRTIPAEQALKFFREGKTDLLPRFISKKGRPFAAYLKLEEGKAIFEFAPREKKPPAKKKTAAAAPK